MPEYATIIPKADADAPANTGRGWAFQHDSVWHDIGEGKYFTREQAEVAARFFTPRGDMADPRNGECLVDIEYHEGALTIVPTDAPRVFPCPLCKREFTAFDQMSAHVKECAQAETRAVEASKKQEAESQGHPAPPAFGPPTFGPRPHDTGRTGAEITKHAAPEAPKAPPRAERSGR